MFMHIYWRSITAAFELPSDAMLTETRVIVEGKLSELVHDPSTVLIGLSDSDDNTLHLVKGMGRRELLRLYTWFLICLFMIHVRNL